METKLWLLRPTPLGESTNWEPWYDKCFGFIVKAVSENEARKFADSDAGNENRGEFLERFSSKEKHPWLNQEYSTCEHLTDGGETGVIMQDFRSA